MIPLVKAIFTGTVTHSLSNVIFYRQQIPPVSVAVFVTLVLTFIDKTRRIAYIAEKHYKFSYQIDKWSTRVAIL